MREPRFFLEQPLAPGTRVPLPGPVVRHLRGVLRARQGAALCLFNGRGGEYQAFLAGGGTAATAEVKTFREVEREASLAVTLLQGLARAPRMDLIVRQAVELGVRRIIPVLTERTGVRLSEERIASRLRHWRQVVIAACEQCGRNQLPPVAAPQPLPDVLQQQDCGARLVLQADTTRGLATLPPPDGKLVLLLGPEGGFSLTEQALTEHAGFLSVSLGTRVLRTETAAAAALSACQALWGAPRLP